MELSAWAKVWLRILLTLINAGILGFVYWISGKNFQLAVIFGLAMILAEHDIAELIPRK